MFRLGLIGAGRHGARYARHATRGDVPGLSLAALWRRDPARGREQASALGVRFEAELDALIAAPDVDALALVVPAGLHADIALRVAAAGKPLLVEKPLAVNAAEGRRMVEAFARAQKPLMVAQTLRFDPLTLRLRDRARELGELRGFRFEQRIEPRGLAWEDDPALSGGGVLIQTGIHVIDALRFVTGVSQLRVLHAATARMQYARNEDHVVVSCAIERAGAKPVLGDIAASKIGTSRHMRYAVFLERGAIEADYVARTAIETRGRDREVITLPELPTVPPALDAFMRCAKGEAPNPIPGEDALETLAIIDRAYAIATRLGD